MIPFVDLRAQYQSIKPEIDEAMGSVLEQAAYIRGPALGEFEKAFAGLIGVDHAIGVASGTSALHLAVRALGLGPGDQVITVTNTWISTAYAVSYAGARPVLIDIDPQTYQMDVAALERAITPATKAVIPVHMFGHPAPMAEIMDICGPKGIRIIEDVAQAPLAETGGRRTGTMGDLACYSFYPSKNLGCYGDGGAVLTNDSGLAETVRHLANYGQAAAHEHVFVGYNSRLDTLQAAVLLAKLPHLGEWTRMRRERAARYLEKLKGLDITLPVEAPGAKSVYHIFVIQTARRDECIEYLRENGIMAQVHYPNLIHRQPCYAGLGYGDGDFPVAAAWVEKILSLPMYPELTDRQIDLVADVLSEFVNSLN
ncbi:MAG TPA: DegT/DnrJ/EryC1/StrS family aminotransferase [Alphaproteobacteria bacterium]|nr:DegT/DnrJ/EryC1/StrS family aminotransferase [Alphaproteobacteria bacterium]